MAKEKNNEDCIFCKIVRKEIPAEIVFESVNVVAFNDLNPQAPTHVLLIPTLHVENAAAMAEASAVISASLLKAAKQIASDRELPGYRTVFNTGEAVGQSVFHAHMHLLGGRDFTWPPG